CRVDFLPIRLSPVGAGRVTAAAGSYHDSTTNGLFCFASTTRHHNTFSGAGHTLDYIRLCANFLVPQGDQTMDMGSGQDDVETLNQGGGASP
ncbi:MAG: hypothetical protein OXE84_09805, partial [Rhodobacteraceae bacterium]|nr:hypothetical protein [Paracoccaceae bacterium]